MGCSSSVPANIDASSATPTTAGVDASPFGKLLGGNLVSASGTVSTAAALAGKTVGLYFSAHWCPPCRGFTPKLAEAYRKHLKAKGLEIVFVSSDQNEAAFKAYFREQPWLAIPFAARDLKAKLGDKFGVRGIPTLVLLKPDGKLLSADGRGKVMQDPTGKSWLPNPAPAVAAAKTTPVPKPLNVGGLGGVIGGAPLVDTDGKTPIELAEAVKDAPLVALYFSAHWCGPCRAFTPKLITFVEMLAEENISLPVIFGSSDRDAAAFDDYFASMPWVAFPHGDKRIEALKSKYEVSGIPWLVVLDAAGNLVVNEADTDVPMGPQAYQKWLKMAKKDPEAAPAA